MRHFNCEKHGPIEVYCRQCVRDNDFPEGTIVKPTPEQETIMYAISSLIAADKLILRGRNKHPGNDGSGNYIEFKVHPGVTLNNDGVYEINFDNFFPQREWK